MERLTQTSDKGGVAFTFDLDITCKPSEAQKILRLADKLKQYEDLGTVEELSRMVNEEDVVKFYYCESEDDYLIGMRIDTLYYARYDGKSSWAWSMSRFLDWGKNGLPSEPKEVFFTACLVGFLKKHAK